MKTQEIQWRPIATAPEAYNDADFYSFNNDLGGLGIAQDCDSGEPICFLWWEKHSDGVFYTPILWAPIIPSPDEELIAFAKHTQQNLEVKP
jgi:hypothetical protein